MNNKKLTALGCLLMLGAIVSPGVIAHIEDDQGGGLPRPSTGLWQDRNLLGIPDTNGNSGANPHVDECAGNPAGPGDCPAVSIDRVSGWYIGPAGPFVSFTHDDPLDDETSVSFGGGAGLCDLEVVAYLQGNVNTDETQVDGFSPGGGTRDNVWNDGGVGVVCHVNYGAGSPFPPEYSTPGCGEAYNSPAHGGGRAASPHLNQLGAAIPTGNGNAIAEDAVFGAEVWIGTACDWSHPVGAAVEVTLLDLLLSDLLSAINCVSGQDLTCFLPPGPPPPVFTDTWNCLVLNTLTCLQTQIDCLLGNPTCPPTTTGTACGDDGFADAGYFGEGDGHQTAGYPTTGFGADEEEDWQVHDNPPGTAIGGTGTAGSDYWNTGVNEPGVPFPFVQAPCVDADGYAAVFLFDSVNVVYEEDVFPVTTPTGNVDEDTNVQGVLLDINVAEATHGWVA